MNCNLPEESDREPGWNPNRVHWRIKKQPLIMQNINAQQYYDYRQGYEVQVGKLDDREIDFICYRGQEKLYIQAAYLLTPSDMEREFGNLESIRDNYPKYVISSDIPDMSRNGIIHKNMIQILKGE